MSDDEEVLCGDVLTINSSEEDSEEEAAYEVNTFLFARCTFRCLLTKTFLNDVRQDDNGSFASNDDDLSLTKPPAKPKAKISNQKMSTGKHKTKIPLKKAPTYPAFKSSVSKKIIKTHTFSKKPKDKNLHKHFIIKPLPDGGVSVECIHCIKFTKPRLVRFNPTIARCHLVNDCKGIDNETKLQLHRGSQASKRSGGMIALNVDPTATIGDVRRGAISSNLNMPPNVNGKASKTTSGANNAHEPIQSPRYTTTKSVSTGSNKKPRIQPSINSDNGFGKGLTMADIEKIIIAEVKTILARGETPERLLDDYARASLIVRYPGIGKHLPNHVNTIFNNYVVNIDISSEKELEDFIKKLPGLINISFDGATVNGKQKVRFVV